MEEKFGKKEFIIEGLELLDIKAKKELIIEGINAIKDIS